MAEHVRSIRVALTVETNKRTERLAVEVDSLDEVKGAADDLAGQASELLGDEPW